MKKLLPILFIFWSFQSFCQWTSTSFSEAKVQMGAVAYGSKAYFGGGNNGSGLLNTVDIYDITTDSWTSSQLSNARSFPAAVASNGKVFFAGGINFNNLTHYATVDILDTLTHQWSTASLSSGKMYIQAASVGNKILFAGGYKILAFGSPPTFEFTDVVDIYDTSTGIWSTQSLSEARAGMAVAEIGDLAIFAGGQNGSLTVSDRVDIFNAQTGLWSTASLSIARASCTATAVGGKVLIAGGVTNDNLQSDRVDIFDASTGAWTTGSLSEGRCFTTMSASACGKAFFAAGGANDLQIFSFTSASNVVDIYDSGTETWTTDLLPKSVVNHNVLGLMDHVLVAGGISFPLSPNSISETVDIFTCKETSSTAPGVLGQDWIRLSPNPVKDMLRFDYEGWTGERICVSLINLTGQVVLTENTAVSEINISSLPNGIYFVRINAGIRSFVAKVLKN